ncbi:MAG: hypothetical protein F7C38_02245 [Desulfurococcales archaeon]|nr:hypothetical protein [Desulfurococcales archaeon]
MDKNVAASIAIILLVIAVAAVMYANEAVPANTRATTTPSTTTGAANTPKETTTSTTVERTTSTTETGGNMGASSGNSTGNAVTLTVYKFSITIYHDDGNLTLQIELPNPCYKANLTYQEKEETLILDINSPPPGTVCVQVLHEETLTVNLGEQVPDQVLLVVRLDGRVVGKATVELG